MFPRNLTPILCFFLCFSSSMQAQEQEVLFPNQEGSTLLKSLVEVYKPGTILNYHDAREYMYTKVYNVDGKVECVYTGHTLSVSPNASNPIFQLSKLGSANGIICEHTYPQSKGAETGNAESNMHHLVPARLAANVARLNHPLGEIPDEETNIWLINGETLFDKPASNLDAYSEQINGRFEPREQHKGNAARMIFYFYTMYQAEADKEDPEFFELQRETLCNWHIMDPVDEKEYQRTFLIAEKQEGKVNPFILDCTLASRIYCSTSASCLPTSTTEVINDDLLFKASPNPVADNLKIDFHLEENSRVQLTLFDALGRKLLSLIDETLAGGNYTYNIPVGKYPSGLMITQMRLISRNGKVRQKNARMVIR